MAITQSFSTDATLLTVRSKAPAFHKDAADLTLRGRMINALLKKWGGLLFNADLSWVRVWNVKTQLPTVSTWVDSADINFVSGPEPEQFAIGDGSYIATDRLTEMEWERMKGARTQIQNYYKEKSVDLAQAMSNNFNYAFLHGTGANRQMAGMDTFLAAGTTVAADLVAKPDDTYAGLDTDVGAVGGTWDDTLTTAPNASIGNDWPQNTGSSQYDAKSPLLLNSSSTNWQTGSTWDNNCEEVMRYWHSIQKHRGGKVVDAKAPITFLQGEQRKRDTLSFFSSRNYQQVPIKEAVDLGFPETLYFEGCWLAEDYDVAANEVYCIQPDMLEFYTSFDSLWRVSGPFFFEPELAYLYNTRMLGNFRFQPKFHGKIEDYA